MDLGLLDGSEPACPDRWEVSLSIPEMHAIAAGISISRCGMYQSLRSTPKRNTFSSVIPTAAAQVAANWLGGGDRLGVKRGGNNTALNHPHLNFHRFAQATHTIPNKKPSRDWDGIPGAFTGGFQIPTRNPYRAIW